MIDFVGYLSGVESPAGLVGLFEFAGYSVGGGTSAANAGYLGTVDFAGYPVGQEEQPAFVGFLDFAGFSVGTLAIGPDSPVGEPGHGDKPTELDAAFIAWQRAKERKRQDEDWLLITS